MDPRFIFFGVLLVVLILIDVYTFQAVKSLYKRLPKRQQNRIYYVFWGFTIFTMGVVIAGILTRYLTWPPLLRNYLMAIVFIGYISKLLLALFMLVDDLARFFHWLRRKFTAHPATAIEKYPTRNGITRSDFLLRSGVFVAMLPAVTLVYGMVKGAYDYVVIRKNVHIPRLPHGFKGMRIAQISDLHAGSFAFPGYVNRVVEKVMEAQPDMILFTGDLVNNLAEEMDPFMDILRPLEAPMGIYSILGNHDYGEYMTWDSEEEKADNFRRILEIQYALGWKVLRNEHVMLERNGSKMALAGVENWSSVGNFMQYGDLEKALQGAKNADTTFLLTHDPSHWEKQVLPLYPQIAMTFSGHTHGMQFGVDLPRLKWSPVQYAYKYWHGLYREGHQQLYVNRGLGFTGFPGRVGMTPEVTIFDFST